MKRPYVAFLPLAVLGSCASEGSSIKERNSIPLKTAVDQTDMMDYKRLNGRDASGLVSGKRLVTGRVSDGDITFNPKSMQFDIDGAYRESSVSRGVYPSGRWEIRADRLCTIIRAQPKPDHETTTCFDVYRRKDGVIIFHSTSGQKFEIVEIS